MKLLDILEELIESVHPEKRKQFRTKVRDVKENLGSRNIRNLVENSVKMVSNMMKDGTRPSPKDQESMEKLRMASDKLNEVIGLLRSIKDKK